MIGPKHRCGLAKTRVISNHQALSQVCGECACGNIFTVVRVEFASTLGSLAGIDAESTILELGCGTGSDATYLALTFGGIVTAVDASQRAIGMGRAFAREEGPALFALCSPQLTYAQATWHCAVHGLSSLAPSTHEPTNLPTSTTNEGPVQGPSSNSLCMMFSNCPSLVGPSTWSGTTRCTRMRGTMASWSLIGEPHPDTHVHKYTREDCPACLCTPCTLHICTSGMVLERDLHCKGGFLHTRSLGWYHIG